MTLPRREAAKGPLRDYLDSRMDHARRAGDPAIEEPAKEIVAAVRRLLKTEDGELFMEFLSVATTEFGLDPRIDACALAALNAQSLIAHDLRRIVNDENYLGQPQPSSRTGRRNRGG
ncbi:hypothetical protein JANAI62_03760 [Jannaschia pagri]|uniref:Uncharacterized protein n=1 Tax=Jannaschia pagri TaxID=2829797 RepID=A0ABQ4NH52_9RHOB|nr:hypothetical protein [Jannaschia sp. AI_61]GIT90141.1 hypothetical protein JANAI61_05990 [Jannaschia sp. AI_61]GIT93753.1 hypothetical protein JANAI62_03760 [Jannaschia sp. AI_62]